MINFANATHGAAGPALRQPPMPAATVPSVARAMAVLELLAQERIPMTLAGLAGRLGLPKSSAHALCHTLLDLGYLRRQGGAGFFLGPAVMPLADAFVSGTDVGQAFNAVWDESGASPEETMILSVLSGTDVLYLAARAGARPLGLAFRVGMRLPANLAASGRAMLAHLPPKEVQALYAASRPAAPVGGKAPTLSQLAAELAATRARGYSVDDEGVRAGVYCIGAPVFDASAAVVAGVGICMQKAALDERTRAQQVDTVQRVAAALSRRLGLRLPVATEAAR